MKNVFKKLTIILSSVVFLCVFALSGCKSYSVINDLTAFNTDVYILVYGKALPKSVKTQIANELDALDKEFSLNDDFSQTSFTIAFNHSQSGVALDNYPNAKAVLEECKNVNLLTKKFNPTIRTLLDAWKLSSTTFIKNDPTFIPPSQQTIDELLSHANFDKVVIQDSQVLKQDASIKLDLGGVIKGYATEKIKNLLSANGYDKGYINIGGSSLYIFSVDDDLAIKHPRKRGEIIITVNKNLVKNKSVSTSGDYIRYHELDGTRYSHIIDGETGKPANGGFSSVTVIGENGCYLDAISTALTCMDKQAFVDFCKVHLSDCAVFGVYENDTKILTNKKQGEHFTLLDNEYSVENF